MTTPRIAYSVNPHNQRLIVAVQVAPWQVIKIDPMGAFDSGFTFDEIVTLQGFTEITLEATA